MSNYKNGTSRGLSPRGEDGTADDKISRLLKELKSGPKSRRELEATLHVGRNVLTKRFLGPAEKKGLVAKTKHGSSPSQKYQLATAAMEKQDAEQVASVSEAGSPNPASGEFKLSEKQAEPQGNGISASEAHCPLASTPVNLVRYHRWTEAEKALIEYFRVERALRNMFATGGWKQFGIVNKLGEDPISCGTVLVHPRIWGCTGGITLSVMEYDLSGQLRHRIVGESNLLRLLASSPALDMSVCSSAEWTEMMELSSVISPAELYLARYYEQYFKISRGLDNPYRGNGNVIPVAADPFATLPFPRMIFHGKAGAIQFQLGFIDLGNRAMFLPVKYYASTENPTAFCMMPEVPETPVLFNSEMIAKYPGAAVILSDEIGIPLVNGSSGNYIFSTWYGGMEVIDQLDFDLLDGHPLQWLCTDDGDDPKKTYEKAVKVGAIFQKHGLKITFMWATRVKWYFNTFCSETGTCESVRLLSFDELKVEAAKYGVCSSSDATDDVKALRVFSLSDLLGLKPEEFVLCPVLKPGFYCLIYGGSGVAKTWTALHIAIALSHGETPFDKWTFQGKAPLNVLYVAGEMRVTEFGERLRKLLEKQETNPHFSFIREDLDLTNSVDQKRIVKAVNDLKSQVVVLDNLSTLATNGHTEGQFEKVLSLIRKLQAAGIIVVLVHHENREGDFKGSGKIDLVADQSLHLFPAGNGETIELIVHAEKVRSTSKAEQTAFRTVFDPKKPVSVWPTFELTAEERHRLDIDTPLEEAEANIRKVRSKNQLAWKYRDREGRAVVIIGAMLRGDDDVEIADTLGVTEKEITDFKELHGISSENLKLHLPEIYERVKKVEKNITPDMLAVEIWNSLKDKADKKN